MPESIDSVALSLDLYLWPTCLLFLSFQHQMFHFCLGVLVSLGSISQSATPSNELFGVYKHMRPTGDSLRAGESAGTPPASHSWRPVTVKVSSRGQIEELWEITQSIKRFSMNTDFGSSPLSLSHSNFDSVASASAETVHLTVDKQPVIVSALLANHEQVIGRGTLGLAPGSAFVPGITKGGKPQFSFRRGKKGENFSVVIGAGEEKSKCADNTEFEIP